MFPMTVEKVFNEASAMAEQATDIYVQQQLGGLDAWPCGFAWVNIYEYEGKKIRANSKMGKALAEMGVRKSDYDKCFRVWNPSGTMMQNMDCKEEGARAFAQHLQKFGFTAYAGSRMD